MSDGYLLDTNVISELRKIGDRKANANVAAWIDAQDAESFFISVITILELERGVLGVQSVASEVGYDDVAFFREVFKRSTGMTPAQYRTQFAPLSVQGAVEVSAPATVQ